MIDSTAVETLRIKYQRMQPLLNERLRRQWAACEALALGRGGSVIVATATGLSRTTIWTGILEVQQQQQLSEAELQPHRQRVPGGGRPTRTEEEPTLVRDLEALVEPTTRGHPRKAMKSVIARWLLCCMRWTTACKGCGKPGKAPTIRTETLNSSTSIAKYAYFRSAVSR